MFFAIGSTFFTYLLVRGRLVPMALAWLGLTASILLVIALPLRLVGLIGSPMAELVWIPMAAFEVPLGIWLMMKGVLDYFPRPELRELVGGCPRRENFRENPRTP